MPTPKMKLDDYWNSFAAVLQDFPTDQQHIGVTLYRELARGEAITTDQVAAALQVTPQQAADELEREPIRGFIHRKGDRIVGFAGISTAPMHHEVRVNGKSLWTWCAWDGLFIPKAIDATAQLSSPDPQTGQHVRITVSPDQVLEVEPEEAVVSFLVPEASDFDKSATNVMAQFCHHVFFFESQKSADRWRASKKGTLLFSVQDAFDLGQRLVSKQFGNALAQRSAV